MHTDERVRLTEAQLDAAVKLALTAIDSDFHKADRRLLKLLLLFRSVVGADVANLDRLAAFRSVALAVL